MRQFELMDALGDLPETYFSKCLPKTGGSAPDADAPEDDAQPVIRTEPAEPRRFRWMPAAVLAACLALAAGFGLWMKGMGSTPSSAESAATSLPAEHTAEYTAAQSSTKAVAETAAATEETVCAEYTAETETTLPVTSTGAALTEETQGCSDTVADASAEMPAVTETEAIETAFSGTAEPEQTAAVQTTSASTASALTETAALNEEPFDGLTGRIRIHSWAPQTVGKPLDYSAIWLNLDAWDSDGNEYTFSFGSNEVYRHCWYIDDSAVDYSKPGTYTVWLVSAEGETEHFTHYTWDSSRQPAEFTVRMENSRAPFTVELLPYSDVLTFWSEEPGLTMPLMSWENPDDYGKGEIRELSFNNIWSYTLELKNVWDAETVTYTVSDPEKLTPGETWRTPQSEFVRLYCGKTGDVTLTAETSDGRTASVLIHVYYENDDLSQTEG